MESATVDGKLQDSLPALLAGVLGVEPHQFEVHDGARLEVFVDVVVADREHDAERRNQAARREIADV